MPQRSIAESVVRDLAAEVAIDEAALHQATADAAYREGVRLDFPVAEDYLADIRVDAPVTFTLNADASEEYPARVATLVPVMDPGARTFLLRVLPTGSGPRLIPGMSVRASLKLATGCGPWRRDRRGRRSGKTPSVSGRRSIRWWRSAAVSAWDRGLWCAVTRPFRMASA